MVNITLPDGTIKSFDQAVSVLDVAQSIGAGLAKAALAGVVDGKLVDMSTLIEADANLSIITDKSPEGLEIIRHSCAHLLAQAVQTLFPEAQVTIGPVIEDGFYYDFVYPQGFAEADLEKIEAKMKELAKQDMPVSRRVMPRGEAVKFFKDLGEDYKVKIIEDIPGDEDLSFYQQADFVDLCRGPHVPNVNRIKAFKLTKVSGAYWRGDSNNAMLQRIYGTAWANKKDLQEYLHRIEEAEKRDHRKIAKEQDLFHLQPEAPGMVFWHPNGWAVYQILEQYLREKLRRHDYQEIKTPLMASTQLWEKSGHLANYSEHMFMTESEGHNFAIKPMSCALHIETFKQGLKSYRDLPIRFSEFGCCHRNELSGTLHGLMRVRNFTQDDAHIFCGEEQIQSEALSFVKLLEEVYADFGFEDVRVALSTRPEKRVGDDALWDKAEGDLKAALEASGLEWSINEGDGAFYGPKIDFSLKDCLGRVWQLGTLQLDYSLPGRLGAQYVAESGEKKTPVMLHRAILGSFERFIGILIEHYAGIWPVWLAPKQVVIMPITDVHHEFAKSVQDELKNQGVRVDIDLRNEKIGYKIRQHTLNRVPFQLVIGDRERDSAAVAVRTLHGEDLGSMPVAEFLQHLQTKGKALGKNRSA